MTLLEHLRQLADAEADIVAMDDGRLWIAGGQPPAVRAAVLARKPELAGLLAAGAVRGTFHVPNDEPLFGRLAVWLVWLRLERDQFSVDEYEWWIERAAIREYDGSCVRWRAEALAAEDVVRARDVPRPARAEVA